VTLFESFIDVNKNG